MNYLTESEDKTIIFESDIKIMPPIPNNNNNANTAVYNIDLSRVESNNKVLTFYSAQLPMLSINTTRPNTPTYEFFKEEYPVYLINPLKNLANLNKVENLYKLADCENDYLSEEEH